VDRDGFWRRRCGGLCGGSGGWIRLLGVRRDGEGRGLGKVKEREGSKRTWVVVISVFVGGTRVFSHRSVRTVLVIFSIAH